MENARKIVVVVEEVEVAKTALQWALHNLVRYGDSIILLYTFPSTNSKNKKKKKTRLLRLKGYHLALSFKEYICNGFPNTKVEIVVTEGDQEGLKIAAMVREIEASTLVVGLHDHSFLYKLAMAHNNISDNFNCRVLAIKQPPPSQLITRTVLQIAALDGSTSMDFSQIELAGLNVLPDIPRPKIPYRICPDPSAIIWRSRKSMIK